MRDFLEEILIIAGEKTKGFFGKTKMIRNKTNRHDVVTEADIAANQYLLDRIRERFPDHGIISEEFPAEREGAEYVWIIDPLDGTKNFSIHVPAYGTMIAVAHNKQIVLAGIYLPSTEEIFIAEKGGGVTLNKLPSQCSPHFELSHSQGTLCVRFAPDRVDIIEPLVKEARNGIEPFWVANFYTHALNMGLVAAGRYDWAISKGASVWDYAAPALILAEAGCTVTNEMGEPWQLSDTSMVAANPVLHAKIMAMLKS